MQLYRLLSIYKLIKPPKFGNCKTQDIGLFLPDLKGQHFDYIFSKPKTDCSRQNNINHFVEIVKKIAKETDYEYDFDELFPDLIISEDMLLNMEFILNDESSWNNIQEELAPIIDVIIFYVTGFLCRKMKKFTKCERCLTAFESCTESVHLLQAELVNEKNRGGLVYANSDMYNLFRVTEHYFRQNLQNKKNNVYQETMLNGIENIKFSFPCSEHKLEMMVECLDYYIMMRMRQWAKVFNNNIVKASAAKAKLAKLETQ